MTVRVTRTCPSFSRSSMAVGASFQDSLRRRTERPEPLRVWRWISVRRAALLRKLNSCCFLGGGGWRVREEGKREREREREKTFYFVRIKISLRIVLDFIV